MQGSVGGKSEYSNRRTMLNELIKLRHIFVEHPDAARRGGLANGLWLIGAMNAVDRRAEIDGAGAEGILDAAFHEGWQFRVTGAHFCWRTPIRPFRLEADLVGAGPFKTLASRRYPVFHSLA